MSFTEGFSKREKVIVDAYLDLMNEKPYDKIRVTDIVERSGVARSTFYSYFQDSYDLLDRIERRLLERLSLYKSSDKEARSEFAGMPFESMENWFDTCIELRHLVAPIMGENGDPYFFRRLQAQMRREVHAMMDDDGAPKNEKRPYYVEICTAAYLGILSYLITTNEDTKLLSSHEMATIANSARAAWFKLDETSPDIPDTRLFGATRLGESAGSD